MYILKTMNLWSGYEYRVSYLGSVENIFIDPQILYEAFKDSECYHSESEAIDHAMISDDYHLSEYGVCFINQYCDRMWHNLLNEETNGKVDLSRHSAYEQPDEISSGIRTNHP